MQNQTSDPATPLITVIVPTFNSAATLAHALQSLAAQTYRDFEVVVSDGASRDASVSIAEGFASTLPALRVDSRPDAGVYDAINQGINKARGEWVLILGSDDGLHAPDTLARVVEPLKASQADVVHGDVRVMGPNALGVESGARYAGPLPLDKLTWTNVCQQAIFYRRSLFARLGNFNQRYRVWGDWDFNLRAAFDGPFEWVDVVLCDYATTGLSSGGGDPVFAAEMGRLFQRELTKRPFDRRLWPIQRVLLRHARIAFNKRRWGEVVGLGAAYAGLRAARLLAVLGPRPH